MVFGGALYNRSFGVNHQPIILSLNQRHLLKKKKTDMLGKGPCIVSGINGEELSVTVTPDWLKGEKTYKTVAVEGNIGCGKTTFLQYFRSRPRVHILPEPVEKWKSLNGFNCFKHGRIKMIERSVYSARKCFVENLYQKGLMSDLDYTILQKWHEWLSKNANIGVDLIVYLKASPETCYNRIKKRNRSEECDISLDYLKDLHRLHENWLIHKKCGPLPAPVLTIDVDCPLSDVTRKIEQHAPAILFEN
ncbi:thymidine kinase 2, mitochondrial-like isoform X2 [Pomacea canaliculata]|uniref:thymidine kinase 2, mitochondrial-like isoform X2 n=1 Tax=Pomacea canaliculata TaxID=400727 RepID=UPI000D73FBE3|nr:thymidine kinase 2, mitochondrial-like isoform X2 [Pomacea canaliculata]